MQNTRLNTIVNVLGGRFWRWASNPWRRVSLLLLSPCFGFVFGAVVITTAGQRGTLDILCSAIALLCTEIVSIYVYRTAPQRQTFIEVLPSRLLAIEMLNTFKIGFVFSLFLDAFKLGS